MISIVIQFPTDRKTGDGQTIYEEKTFTQNVIMGRLVRKAIEFRKLSTDDFNEATLDEMIAYVCLVFENRFTVDQFYDGVPASDMVSEVWRVINAVIAGCSVPGATSPNSPAGK